MCLGDWSLLDLVEEDDLTETARLPEFEGEEHDIPVGWDKIKK